VFYLGLSFALVRWGELADLWVFLDSFQGLSLISRA